MAAQEEQAQKMMEEHAKKMGRLTAKAWSDENFKKKLVSDPAATLKAEGVDLKLPAGVSLRAVENTEKVFYVVIPAKPADLSDEELEKVAGGVIGCVRPCATQPPCATQFCIHK